MERSERRVGAAIALFFVSPFVAEYLLGDLPLTLLGVIVIMAPMYGGGAVLIREVARRTGRGWPSMLLLGAAFAVLEEGFVTQSLFNPDYLKLHMHFLQIAHVPWIGMGAWWTMLMLNLHTFWSIGSSIALTEGMCPESAERPWLRGVGTAVFGVIFVLGLVGNWAIGYKQNGFTASPLQFAVAGVVFVVLVGTAFAVPRGRRPALSGAVPNAWVCGGIALGMGVLLLAVPPRWGWGAVASMLLLDLVFLGVVAVVSRRGEWKPVHAFGLGAGGALAYGLHAFTQKPVVGATAAMVLVSHVVFFAVAMGLILIGLRRLNAFRAGEAVRGPVQNL